MKAAIFDPFCGVSGNMILGALLDCGLSKDLMENALDKLGLRGWKLTAEKVLKNGMQGTLVTVHVPEEENARHLSDILEILDRSSLPEPVVERTASAFSRLAEAESRAHGIPVEEVHFHEAGAMDAIIDITGAFAGMHLLGIEKVFSSTVAIGTGTVECAHGVLPVPAPATLELLKGVPAMPSGIAAEIATPTGAAILTTAVDGWSFDMPCLVVRNTGMGAGHRNLPRPNLLRLTIAEISDEPVWSSDQCIEITSVVDDMDGRTWPETGSMLMQHGALDFYALPCTGRKGRPAAELRVLCPVEKKDEIIELLFRNTPTIGIRHRRVERAVLARETASVETVYGKIGLKKVYLRGSLLRAEPEYADCQRVAENRGVPISEVITAARYNANRREGGE
ncbi:MAG: nickel pincer cofactor biosynthesis protein LarC [Candidatus Aegiribacteria sp.]|nr:nickel pincer cofactor biosynthesis protein LarC [Candidatus Aegiribacteria sp.]MBD3294160.1 nickel pincer cofactor biosynthesis protein LarC [Candidatus Fermentibacteria bacterium]